MEYDQAGGFPSQVEPILAVQDIAKTVVYWHEVLGFPEKWTWGEPPNHGGVSWCGVSIQFSLNPGLAFTSRGNAVFISTKKLESLYVLHQKLGAEITEPLENKPWGVAAYTVRELNGYDVIFSGALLSDRKQNSTGLPSTVKIISRRPTVKEYHRLASAVGWWAYLDDEVLEKLLAATLFAVVAENTTSKETIGCALALGDDASFYYVKDVIVHPDWQNKNVGSALMKELTYWLEDKAANNALVALITPESLGPFYRRFGFTPAFSMIRYISNEK